MLHCSSAAYVDPPTQKVCYRHGSVYQLKGEDLNKTLYRIAPSSFQIQCLKESCKVATDFSMPNVITLGLITL